MNKIPTVLGPPGCSSHERDDTTARFDSVRIEFTPDGARVRFNPDNVVVRIFGLNHPGLRLLEIEAYPDPASRQWGDGFVVLRLEAGGFDIGLEDDVLELRNGGAMCRALKIRTLQKRRSQ